MNGRLGDAHYVGQFRIREAGEIMQFNDLCLALIERLEFRQCSIEREDFDVVAVPLARISVKQSNMKGTSTALGGVFRVRVVDENSPHHACRNSEEMIAVLPVDVGTDELLHGLVDQRGRLQRVPCRLASEDPRCKLVQLLVDDRSQLLESALVAISPFLQQLRYGSVRHSVPGFRALNTCVGTPRTPESAAYRFCRGR